MRLILASNSPRRRDILRKHGIDFDVSVGDFSESDEKDPVSTAVDNAAGKAKTVFDGLSDADKKATKVLGADTVVFYDGKIIGKPKDAADAVKTLKMLSGKTHKVVTVFAVVTKDGVKSGYDVSEITFNELSDELIDEYVKTGLPLDKAGSYGYQDGFPIVKTCVGDEENVIGLPFLKLKAFL